MYILLFQKPYFWTPNQRARKPGSILPIFPPEVKLSTRAFWRSRGSVSLRHFSQACHHVTRASILGCVPLPARLPVTCLPLFTDCISVSSKTENKRILMFFNIFIKYLWSNMKYQYKLISILIFTFKTIGPLNPVAILWRESVHLNFLFFEKNKLKTCSELSSC